MSHCALKGSRGPLSFKISPPPLVFFCCHVALTFVPALVFHPHVQYLVTHWLLWLWAETRRGRWTRPTRCDASPNYPFAVTTKKDCLIFWAHLNVLELQKRKKKGKKKCAALKGALLRKSSLETNEKWKKICSERPRVCSLDVLLCLNYVFVCRRWR